MKKTIGLIATFVFLFSLTILLVSCNTTTTPTTSTTTTTISGLTAHYAFNEGSGTAIADSSGNGLSGTLYGGTWITGRSSGNAISFDGTNDYVQIPASGEAAPSQIANLSEGSISIWFKFEGTAGTTGIFYPAFYLGPSPEVSSTRAGLIIEVGHKGIWNTSQELFYTVTLAGSSEPVLCFDSGSNLNDGQWYHFVVTVSSSGNTGYLNGTEMIGREYNFSNASGTEFLSSVASGILAIGCGRSAIDQQFYYFRGTIDDVRIYNRALTATEVQQLYEE